LIPGKTPPGKTGILKSMNSVSLKEVLEGRSGVQERAVRLFPWWVFAVPLLGVVLVLGLCQITPSARSETQAGVRMELPDFLGEYIGIDQEISYAERQILPGDTEFARKVYHHPKGYEILCSIVLAGGEKRSIHRPEFCLPGQGWTIRGGVVRQVDLTDGNSLNVKDLSLTREVQVGPDTTRVIRSHYFYFFVGKGVTTPNHLTRVFLTSWDRVFKGINHRWAYVIVSARVTDDLMRKGKNDEETIEMLKEFTAEVSPLILTEES